MALIRLFSGIPRSDAEKLKNCMGAEIKAYMQGEEIFSISEERFFTVGYVAQGEVSVYLKDSFHNRFLTDTLSFGDVFGEIFYPPSKGISYKIVAETDCEILFFNYNSLVAPCEKICYYHLTLVNNLIKIASDKLKNTNSRLFIMQNRTIRDKISAYITVLSNEYGEKIFDIPLSQTELSEYLAIDRSAMSREFSKMKSEGLLKLKGRHCEILNLGLTSED